MGITVAALLMAPSAAQATDLVVNGGFETTTNGNGQLGHNTIATGWISTDYTFVFAPGTADTTGATGVDGALYLWGTGNGGNDVLSVSPNGGNFIASDPVYESGPITQTINDLTIGDEYAVSFYWAGAQQSGFSGNTTEGWDVSLGSTTQDTTIVHDVSLGFTGWQYQTFDFTASSSTEVLSFLAVGTPSGEPPFALLDGVSMTQVTPEPATLPLLLTGMMGCLGVFGSKKWLKN
jgi:hypothetical protein